MKMRLQMYPIRKVFAHVMSDHKSGLQYLIKTHGL